MGSVNKLLYVIELIIFSVESDPINGSDLIATINGGKSKRHLEGNLPSRKRRKSSGIHVHQRNAEPKTSCCLHCSLHFWTWKIKNDYIQFGLGCFQPTLISAKAICWENPWVTSCLVSWQYYFIASQSKQKIEILHHEKLMIVYPGNMQVVWQPLKNTTVEDILFYSKENVCSFDI